jgi:outer membrane protein
MKNVKKTIGFVVLILTLSNSLSAQKIAHIFQDSLINLMPETKKAMDIAQEYLKQLEKEVGAMQAELDTKYNDYMTNEATYSDLVKRTKQEELTTLNKRIEDFRMQAQQEYQKKQGEISLPIQEKIKEAIRLVAEEKGYSYVLDTSTGLVLFRTSSDNIFNLVKKKLDTMPEAVLPGTKPNTNTPKTPVKGK